MGIKRFRAIVPAAGCNGGKRPQPVWRVGSVLRFCLDLSRVERARLWRHGGVTVNGTPVDAPFTHCVPGDVVEAWYPEETSGVTPEPDLPLEVLYEDAWLLAVAKPAGQLAHPARTEQRGTVVNAVAARYRLPGEEAAPPVRLVHRLDRDTTGVLLFARDAASTRSLIRQRAQGSLTRWYLALVSGHPPARGEIEMPLAADPTHRTRRVVGSLATDGETLGTAPPGAVSARTSYQVVQYGAGAALVAAQLHTGRTHQLRAHLAAIGHPLLGDDLYGGSAWPGLTRQALHAWRTSFRHPATSEHLTLTAPLPDDFLQAARRAFGAVKSER